MSRYLAKSSQIGWLEAWRSRYLRYPSVLILIVANLVPLFGVLYWDWDLFMLMLAYWMETGVIGFWTILHMMLAGRWASLFYIPFFMIHFGGFMLGHLLFLWTMFGDPQALQAANFDDAVALIVEFLWHKGLWVVLAALFVSHGLSFFFNVLMPWWHGTAEHTTVQRVMGAPYGRVIVLHVTILIGAVLAAYFKTKTAAFVLLIALKIFIDVSAHVRKNFHRDDGVQRGLSTV